MYLYIYFAETIRSRYQIDCLFERLARVISGLGVYGYPLTVRCLVHQ